MNPPSLCMKFQAGWCCCVVISKYPPSFISLNTLFQNDVRGSALLCNVIISPLSSNCQSYRRRLLCLLRIYLLSREKLGLIENLSSFNVHSHNHVLFSNIK